MERKIQQLWFRVKGGKWASLFFKREGKIEKSWASKKKRKTIQKNSTMNYLYA